MTDAVTQFYLDEAQRLGRAEAIAPFAASGFPTRASEDWRYTPLNALARQPFAPAPADAGVTAADIVAYVLKGAAALLVFVNGQFYPQLSQLPDNQTVTLRPLADAAAIPAGRDHAVLALNAALATAGADIAVTADPGAPIQILSLATATASGHAQHLRHRVAVAAGVTAELVETFVGPDSAAYWTNAVVEITLQDKANLTHYYRQQEGDAAIHLSAHRVRLDTGALYRRVELSTGASLGRAAIDVEVAGAGARAELHGALLAGRGQRLVARSIIDHAVPGTTSDELYKCVLAGHAVTAFQGKVIVRRDAQHTDAAQANHNLLLARSAEANSKPELEILANDVKCSHGATVGELNKDALFYMQARGLDRAAAQALLVQAFVGEVIERVANEEIRATFAAAAQSWLEAQA